MTLDVRGLAPLLQVYDMPTSVRFYRDMLGFAVVSTSPELPTGSFHWVLLRLGGAELMLNTAYEFDHERPDHPSVSRVVAHRDTGLYFGCENVDGIYAELLAKGLNIKEPRDTTYGMRQLYLRDPDGYTLCFQHPVATT